MSRVHAAKNFKVSDVLAAILLFPQVIRRCWPRSTRTSRAKTPSASSTRRSSRPRATAARAACTFVDIFQEHLNKRIEEHNDYLDQAQKKFGIDLSRFIVFKA